MGVWMFFYALLSGFIAFWTYELSYDFIQQLIVQYYEDIELDKKEEDEMIQKRLTRLS